MVTAGGGALGGGGGGGGEEGGRSGEWRRDEEAALAAMAAGEAIAAAAEPGPGFGRDEEPVGEEPEGESEGEGEAAGGARPPAKMVPHAALHEERTRRQGLEAENRKLAEERALFEGRLQAILGMQPQQA